MNETEYKIDRESHKYESKREKAAAIPASRILSKEARKTDRVNNLNCHPEKNKIK